MDWFKNKTTQLIALVSIVGTLAGFGYTGATYINRLENLEAKIGGIGATKQAQQAIEERFAAIEKSVEYINKSIERGINPSLKAIAEAANESGNKITALQKEVEYLQNDLGKLEKELEKSGENPLSG